MTEKPSSKEGPMYIHLTVFENVRSETGGRGHGAEDAPFAGPNWAPVVHGNDSHDQLPDLDENGDDERGHRELRKNAASPNDLRGFGAETS